MAPLAVLITVIVGLVTLADWRKGVLAVLLIGVLQDVLRKLTPGVPSYFILWAMAVYVVVVMIAMLRRSLPGFTIMYFGDRHVRLAWTMFIALIAMQLLNAFLRYGGVAVPAFGFFFYLGPPLAMLVGAAFANRERRVHQFLLAYVVLFVPVCLTVYFSPGLQDSWPVLREVGSFVGNELIIHSGYGVALESYSGLLRVGEIAAWHAATAAMFLSVLALNSPSTAKRIFWSTLIVLLVGVIILTGRRKMLMTLSIFFVAQWFLLARFRHGMGKLAVVFLVIGTVASYSLTLLEPTSESSKYLQRGSTVFGEAGERFSTSVMLMKSAFNRGGGLGLGAGAGSQGTQYAGVDLKGTVGGSAESGIGKLMVEIGVPGMVLSLLLLVLVARRVFMNMKRVARIGERYLIYQVSFAALIFANLMTFTVATQVYGDMFILIILGTVGGFIVRINDVTLRHPASQGQFAVRSRGVAAAGSAPLVPLAPGKREEPHRR